MLTHFKSQLELQVELRPGNRFPFVMQEAGNIRNIV